MYNAGAHLFNHGLNPTIRNYGRLGDDGQSMSFPAARECKEGEEVFLSYGQLSNDHLLLFYGFALKGNMLDTVTLRVRLLHLMIRRMQGCCNVAQEDEHVGRLIHAPMRKCLQCRLDLKNVNSDIPRQLLRQCLMGGRWGHNR